MHRGKEILLLATILLVICFSGVSATTIENGPLEEECPEPSCDAYSGPAHPGTSLPEQTVLTVGLPDGGAQGYACVVYDPQYTFPLGPCRFGLDTPGNITNLGPAASNFIAAADFANDIWYGIIFGGELVTIDTDTGDVTSIGATADATGMAYDLTTGTMYAVDFNGHLYTIDLGTGAATVVCATREYLITLACGRNGVLYGFDLSQDVLGTINKKTGEWTVIGSLGIDMNYAQDAVFDRNTGILYLAAQLNYGDGQLMTVDTGTGAAHFVGVFENGAEVAGFAIPYECGRDSVSPAASFRPLVVNHLSQCSFLMAEIRERVSCDVSPDVCDMLDMAGERVNSASAMANPIHANGELAKAIGLLQDILSQL